MSIPQCASSSSVQFKVGAIQLNSQADVDNNLALIENALHHAKHEGVHLLVLPENACVMGDQRALATRYDELMAWYGNLAKTHGMFVVAGTLPCPYRPDGSSVPNHKVRQTSLVFAPNGDCLARYDKIHLFKATVADGVDGSSTHYDEGETFEAGDVPAVVTLDLSLLDGNPSDDPTQTLPLSRGGLKSSTSSQAKQKHTIGLGLMICFDLRFPAYAQHLRDLGADILVAPSAFTFKTGQAHWHKLLTARALDAQCMMVGSAQGGTHEMPDGSVRQTWGHGAIVNANGETVAQYPHSEVGDAGFALLTADFDMTAQRTWREALPIFACRRAVGE